MPPWITEAGLATDWAALNPSADEVARLKKAGFAVFEQKPEVFKRDIHADKVILLPFYYGFHVGLEVPAEDVYQMLTIVEKNLPALVKADKGFSQIAKDMPGFPAAGRHGGGEPRADPSGPREIHAREGRLGREVGLQGREAVNRAS